ncbi:MAG: pyridoxamine 5'-phosphate oxidase family protein [Actinomycetota bacterium]|nr:pyridoxamine 5'-phosphate oxidase family protein [Actinomycetota bacterium]
MEPGNYPVTASNTPVRLAERAHYDRATVHAVLDEALICHVAYVRDGRPVLIPTIHARVGERLYLHGSTGASASRAAAGDGVSVCVAATIVDGLVLARSAFHHSMNYRSVVVHGVARPVTDAAERSIALDALVDHVWPGRSGGCRAPSRKELAATTVLALDLLEVSAKVRTGDVADEPEDMDGPWWAGIVPVAVAYGEPVAAGDLLPGLAAPSAGR